MATSIAQRLAQLNIVLPSINTPSANYVPYTISGNTIYIAGQVCVKDGKPTHTGKLGVELDVAAGQAAARVCAMNILSVLQLACNGDLNKVTRCLKLLGFVNAAPDFTDVPLVVNGASDLIVEVFGDAGRHARSAVGVATLPRGAAVEVEAVFAVRA
jgi:enamine deaminase RidA (YjgF/YER057c/UK114 family)